MTWKEFKDFVESQGVKDGDVIGMVDAVDRWPIEVHREANGEITICCAADE